MASKRERIQPKAGDMRRDKEGHFTKNQVSVGTIAGSGSQAARQNDVSEGQGDRGDEKR